MLSILLESGELGVWGALLNTNPAFNKEDAQLYQNPTEKSYEEGGKVLLYHILLPLKNRVKLKALLSSNPSVDKGG